LEKAKRASKMKGVSFVMNDKNERIAVQIDMELLQQHQGEIEDYLDGIIAESRAGGETLSWEEAKRVLKDAGKL
jgi:hypothetical protein